MNRDEKNLLTRRKIIDSALGEFSQKSYGEASMNMICSVGNISKGIIYHYFKDKDELYLNCVKECFDALTGYLKNMTALSEELPAEEALVRYFDLRIAFFAEYPIYCRLFCNTLVNPPAHLSAAITGLTEDFDALNLSLLTKLLESVKLRSDIGIEEVVTVFRIYQDYINTRFQVLSAGEGALQKHEALCHHCLKILLYGVMER